MGVELLAAFTGFLRSLSFGGLLGGGLAAVLHIVLFQNAAPPVPFTNAVVAGTLLGSAFHRPLALSWNHFFGPLANLATTEVELRKLAYYRKRGWISEDQYRQIAANRVDEDITSSFLRESHTRVLPPGDDA